MKRTRIGSWSVTIAIALCAVAVLFPGVAFAFGTVTGDVVNDAAVGIEGISVVPLTLVDGQWNELGGLDDSTLADGTYTLTLSPGEYWIRFVDNDGRVTGTLGEKYYAYEYYPNANCADAGIPVLVEEGLNTDLGTQTLSEGATISGAVFTEAGGDPLANIHAVAHVQFGGGFPGVIESVTDDAGAYSIVGLPPGTYAVRFEDQSYAYASELYNNQPEWRMDLAEKFLIEGPTSSVTDINAALAPGCGIDGKITDGTNPLPDSTVWVMAYNGDGEYWMRAKQTTALGDGSYECAGLRAGTYRLMVEGPDGSWASECYLDKPATASMGDDIALGGTEPSNKTIDVALAPAGYIDGWVFQEGSGDPIADSPVNACIEREGWFESVAWTSTGANGSFTLAGLAAGSYYVQFNGGDGWIGEIYDNQRDWSMGTPVSVTAGLTTGLSDTFLVAGASIEGYVYEPDGVTPRGDIAVTPVRRVDYGGGNVQMEPRDDLTYFTDMVGHFAFQGLEPGEWALRVSDPTGFFATQYQDGKLIPNETFFTTIASGDTWTPPNIVLSQAGSIVGTVYDDGEPGTPLEGITVAAWLPTGGGYEWIVSDETDGSGAYEILGVMPGDVYLEFQGTNFWLGEYWSIDPVGGTRDRSLADAVTVTGGEAAGPFDAHLDPAASISGRVTTDGGTTGLWGISVVPMLYTDDGEYSWWEPRWDLQAASGETGLFTVGGLAPGTWSLMFTDTNGTYATEYYQERDLQSDADPIVIVAGGPVAGTFDADLELGGFIVGTVSGNTGEPEPTPLDQMGVSINVDRGDWLESVAWASTGVDGAYDTYGLRPGDYVVEFYGNQDWQGEYYSVGFPHTRDWMQATPVSLIAGQTAIVDATLQPAASVTGQVSTFDGVDTDYGVGIDVMLLTFNGERWEYRWDLRATTNEFGFYRIGGLEEADYQVVFQDPNGFWATEFYHDAISPMDATSVGVTSGNWVADEELVPGNTITGTVTGYVEASGLVEPLEGISIAAGPYTEDGYYEHIVWAQTELDGTFSLRGLPIGSFKVQVWDDDGRYVGEFYDDTIDWSLATPVVFGGTGQLQNLGEIGLGTAASVTGYVTNGVDDLADIDVVPCYWEDDGGGGFWLNERWDLSRRTDENGMFTLTGLTPSAEVGTAIMFQDPSGMYARQYYDGASAPVDANPLLLTPGENPLGEIVLELANHITGTVTSDGTTGLGDISVAAGPYDPDTGRYDHTAWAMTSSEPGSEGAYDLGGLPPGSYVVQFWDEGRTYLDQYYSITEPGTRDLAQATPVVLAGSGETSSGVDAQMALGATVSGMVTEPDGVTGIPGVNVVPVYLNEMGNGWDPHWHRAFSTDGDGRFALTGFDPGETFKLLVHDQSGEWAYEYYNDAVTPDAGTDIGPLAAGDNPLGVIALDPANHIQGTVSSVGGPLADMMVAAGIYDRDTGYYEHVSWTMTSSGEGLEGTYDLGGLPPGSYIVQFWDDLGNYGTKYYDGTPQGTVDWNESLAVEFAGNGGTVTGVDVQLEPAAYVSGTVYGDGGAGPLGGIDVELYTYNGEWWDYNGWTTTQDDGTYRFSGLADGAMCRLWFSDWTGTWAAQAYSDKSSWMWGDTVFTEIAVPAEGVDVGLIRAGSITGVVLGDGEPLTGAPVSAGPYDSASDTWDSRFYAETDSEGRYTISGLKPGVAYLVEAGDYYGVYAWTMWTTDGTGDGDWHSGDDVFVEAPPVAPTVCDFDLLTGGYITGHVQNTLGESLVGVDVMLFAPTEAGWDDWWGSFQGVQGGTDENGNYRVGGLYPGDYRIAFAPAEDSGYAFEYYNDQPILSMGTTITVATLGEHVTVDTAVLSEAAAIEGNVYDDGDPATPLEGIEVRLAVATGGEGGWRDLQDRSVLTDASGYYRIEGLRPDDALYVFASDFGVGYIEEWWQEVPGFAEATPIHAPQAGIDFTLGLGGRITGTIVLDPLGTYESIGVTIYQVVGDESEWHFEPVSWVHGGWGGIDGDGHFESQSLPPGEYYVAFYDDSGVYASEYYNDALLPSEATVVNVIAGESTLLADATLTKAAGVSGFVCDAIGNPQAGVEVRALVWDEYWERWEPGGTQFGTSDETGEYFLPAPTGVIFVIQFSDPWGRFATQFYDGVYQPDAAQTFSMTPGETMSGVHAYMLPADSEPPSVAIEVVPATPDGENGWYVTAPTISLTSDDPSATIWYQWGAGGATPYSPGIEPPAGTSTLTYWASDPIGNESEHGTYDFKYDPLAPSAPSNLSADQSGGAEVTVTWDASFDEDSGLSHYELWTSTDGTSWSLEDGAVIGESYLLEGLPSGGLYVKVAAVDIAGNTSLYSPSDYVVVDADKPVTSAIIAPAAPDGENGWYVTVPTITLTCDDPAATIFYTFEPPVADEYATPISAPLGTSTLTYYAVDEWGNTETTHDLVLKVDTVAPAQVTGLDATAVSESAVDLSWSAVTDSTSGLSWYRIYRDGSQVATTTATAYQVTGLAPNMLYNFTVAAEDVAGNVGDESEAAEATTLSDTTAPTTTIEVTGGTMGQNGWYTAAPSIALTTDDLTATTWYQWGASEPLEFTDSFQPPEGENVLTYWSVDGAGNVEDPKLTQTFKLDTTAPPAPTGFNAAVTGPSQVTISWTAVTDPESGVQFYAFQQTGPITQSGVVGSSPYVINSLPDGTYVFTMTARNYAGLLSEPTGGLQVVIDTTAPVTTLVTDPAAPDGTNGWFKSVPLVTLGSTATDLDWIVYRWNDDPTEWVYKNPFHVPIEGTSTLWWHGSDLEDNVEAWRSQEFKVDTGVAAPTGLEATAVGSTGVSLAWNADLVDASGIARYLVYKDGILATEVTDENCQISGLTANTTYVFTLKAVDNAGNESSASVGLPVTTLAPTTFTVTFKDWDGTTLKTEEVASGGAATAPADPTRTGYTFTGWDTAFTNVTSDLSVTATYTINMYMVTFKDWDGTVLKAQAVAYAGSATAPPVPTRDGYIFVSWDKSFAVVTMDLTVTALYTPDTSIVSPVTWETIGGVDYARVAGTVRFDTAAMAALDAFPGGASTAVIAYGYDFPDALAASPLAGAANGPILLTDKATLPSITAATLRDLGVTKVYIVGGTGVVSTAVETAIRQLGITNIERLAGDNRYITARKIADEAVSLGASTTNAFLVRGDDFADALAVASIAAQEKIPVLLTETAALNAEARTFLVGTGTDHVYIAGGTGVVSTAVQQTVDGLAGVDVFRWAGTDRYATGAKVVSEGMALWGIPMVDIGLASGSNYPDALAGGAIMGHKHGLLLLTQPTVLSAPTATLISANKATIETVEYFGGTSALAPLIPTTVRQLLQ